MGTASGTILIAGLKRSGTTILWQTLRQDRASLCFDETFHPGLWSGRRDNGKNTLAELGNAWDRQDYSARPELKPILPLDELDAKSTRAQRDYLADLSALAERTVIDEVRIWNRLPGLLSGGRRPVVVHLIRNRPTG